MPTAEYASEGFDAVNAHHGPSKHSRLASRPIDCKRRHAIARPARIKLLTCALTVASPLYAACTTTDIVTIKPWSTLQNQALGSVSAIDAYADKNTLHVLVAGQTDRPALFYLRTQDESGHWSPAVMLPAGSGTPISRRGNDVQIVAQGPHVVALWQTQGELPGMGPILSATSDDAGKTWHSGISPADSQATDQSHMDAVADSKGRFHLVWLDDRQEVGNYQGLRYARSEDYGRHWQHFATLDDTTCTCCWTRLAVGSDAQLYALYRDGSPHDMVLSTSVDAGLNWRSQGPVGAFGWEFQGCPHAGGGLAMTPDGSLFSLVWTGKDTKTGLHFMHSRDDGKTWHDQIMPDRNGVHADLATLNANALVALWDARSAEGSTVHAAQSCNAGAQWSQPTLQSDPSRSASHPRIVATRHGVFGFWTERLPDGRSQLAFYR